MQKLLGKRLIAFLLVVSVASSSFLPAFAPRAKAFLGIGDITFTMNEIIRAIIDGIAMSLAQKMIDDIVNSTIKWANTGFDGNPAYITDPERYFSDIASGAVGDYIGGSKLGFLCSPFQAQIRLSLVKQYTKEYNPQCTLEQIGVNLENFYDSFHEGGWEGWIKMTQEEGNNPYGAYISAKLDTDQRLANLLALKTDEKRENLGFRGFSECLQRNEVPIPGTLTAWANSDDEGKQLIEEEHPNWNPHKGPGECLKQGPTKTPGSVIKSQLDNVLPSGLDKLISVEHIEGLIGAFASGLLQRFVFSDAGLFSDNSSAASTREIIDVDGDNLPDGYDTDADGELDICHHGLIDQSEPASNENCAGSKTINNSPYFIPICENLATATRAIEVYKQFIDANQFNSTYANTWMNKTTVVSGAVDGLINTISRYEVMAYDPALFTLGTYADYLGKRIESLAKDGDLRGRVMFDSMELDILKNNTNKILKYLQDFKAAMGQCDNPNTNAINQIPPPDIEGETSTTTPTTTSPVLSCSPSSSTARVNEPIVWSVNSSYPSGTEYRWTATDNFLGSATTTVADPLNITYYYAGTKTASINADRSGGEYISRACSSSVTVTQ